MMWMVACFCLAQTRNTEILFPIDEFKIRKPVQSKPFIDKLAQTIDLRHGLFKVDDGRAGMQELANGKGLDYPPPPGCNRQ